eukprot:m.25628 g.25628  ORF g.25628 m.25628 type:complete len:271 (-) comp9200_c0_seq1:662-1474(-)
MRSLQPLQISWKVIPWKGLVVVVTVEIFTYSHNSFIQTIKLIALSLGLLLFWFVVCSNILLNAGDFYPMYSKSHNSTDTILTHLHRVNKKKPVTLIGGDFHMGSTGKICERVNGKIVLDGDDGERNCITRIISSGITIGSAASTSPKLSLFNSGILWTGAPTIPHRAGVKSKDEGADEKREWVNTIEFMKLVNTFVTLQSTNNEPLTYTLTTRQPLQYEHITQWFLFDYGFIFFIGFLISFIYQYIKCCSWLLCAEEKELSKEEEDKKAQ